MCLPIESFSRKTKKQNVTRKLIPQVVVKKGENSESYAIKRKEGVNRRRGIQDHYSTTIWKKRRMISKYSKYESTQES